MTAALLTAPCYSDDVRMVINMRYCLPLIYSVLKVIILNKRFLSTFLQLLGTLIATSFCVITLIYILQQPIIS